MSASKGGYITLSYGAPKPGMPGSSIVLTDGQTFAARPIALMRGAVIAGRLTDQSGRPLSSIAVRADQFVTVNGERRRKTTTGASSGNAYLTNAHGDYRIYGLLPGEYVVSATAVPTAVQTEPGAAEIAWARQPDGPAPSRPRSIVPAPTIFPGTTDAAAGVVIALARGEERLGVNFALQYVPVARVTGTVIGTDGRPAPNAMVLCTTKNPSAVLPPSGVPISMTAADGVFACPGLAPGQYLLAARHVVDPAVRAGLSPTPGMMPLWGMVELTVTGRDVSNVAIQVQTGFSLSGQVEFKSTGAAAAPDPSAVQVRLMQALTTVPVGVSVATLRADGTFQIDGIVPGSYRATVGSGGVAGIPVGWTLRSVMLNGRDIADVPVDVTGNISGAVVTLTDAQTELSGVLADGAGKPAPQLYVFVFPADKGLWGSPRRVQSVRSREDGSYRIAGLPPGDYYLCALTELETTLQTEPSYLEQFVPSSIKITLGEGEKKTQSLKIGG
jgi:protocatechuate 3,4-dioxygenase beta subunit